MIAIETFMQPIAGFEAEAEENFIKFCLTTHPDIFDFFVDCLDQNLILNTVHWTPVDWYHPVHPWIYSLARYYAVDMPKAEQFRKKFQDLSADFSIKKYWYQNKFDITCDLSEVDFSQETPEFEIINKETGALWDIVFPTVVGRREKYFTWPDINYLEKFTRSPSAIARDKRLISTI